MLIKKIKYFIIFSLLMIVASCSGQKIASESLAKKVDSFKEKNNTNVEFLSYIMPSASYSYIVDVPLIVKKIIKPDMALMSYNGVTFVVEFNEKEKYQSFPMLKESSSILFQEGVLLAKDTYYDPKTKEAFKRFKICRTEDCRSLSRVALSYMYKYSKNDPSYNVGDLSKYIVDQDILR